MKHENLFKIYIPKPCHEDWDKMTLNEQGAFCRVCSKTVIDFSGKTDDEIQSYLTDKINDKVCGRFMPQQLSETPRLRIEKPKFEIPRFLFPLTTPARAFAAALLLFASVALTSCGNSEGEGTGEENNQRIERTMGKPQIDPNDEIDTGKIQLNWNPEEMGEVNYKSIDDSVIADTTIKIDTTRSIRLLGKLYVKEDTTCKIETPRRKMGMVRSKFLQRAAGCHAAFFGRLR